MPARAAALSVLIACRRAGAWPDGALKETLRRTRLDARDAALASRLCYGVLQNRMLLDFYLSAFLTRPLKSLQPVVLDILRLGAYQITMLDRIPPAAAIDRAVEQAKRRANPRAAGLVNAVLRALARAKDHLPEPPGLATRYSHPAPLVALLRENVGEERLEPFLRSDNEAPETAVAHNPLRCGEDALLSRWEEGGVRWKRHAWMPSCFLISGNPETLPGYREGFFYVQDAAARLAVRAAGLRPGMRVLDCCAAPGGKSFAAAAELKNRGAITACDIHPHKLALIEAGAKRLGVEILTAAVQDAAACRPDWRESFDAVLVDAPCSGLGVIRKKPDIRYKNLSEMEKLPDLQLKILQTVSQYLKPGGILLYSTCTVLKRENEAVAASVLARAKDFEPAPLALPAGLREGARAMLTLLPCTDECDGFFLAKLRKNV